MIDFNAIDEELNLLAKTAELLAHKIEIEQTNLIPKQMKKLLELEIRASSDKNLKKQTNPDKDLMKGFKL